MGAFFRFAASRVTSMTAEIYASMYISAVMDLPFAALWAALYTSAVMDLPFAALWAALYTSAGMDLPFAAASGGTTGCSSLKLRSIGLSQADGLLDHYLTPGWSCQHASNN